MHCMRRGLVTIKLSVRLSVKRVICDKTKETRVIRAQQPQLMAANVVLPHLGR